MFVENATRITALYSIMLISLILKHNIEKVTFFTGKLPCPYFLKFYIYAYLDHCII